MLALPVFTLPRHCGRPSITLIRFVPVDDIWSLIFGKTLPETYHCDDRRDADNYTEHRKQGSCLVRKRAVYAIFMRLKKFIFSGLRF